MKIMLAIAPWDLWEDQDDDIYPIGIGYLGSVLEKNGYETSLLNLTYSKWEDVREKVVEKIKKEKPDVFGISILSNSRISAKKLLDEVKKHSPNSLIIAGGVHTTFMYEQILNNYPVDFAFLGEAEETIIEFLNTYKNKRTVKEFTKIKGIAFKHNSEIIKTEPRPRIRDLDSLPFPKHEFFEDIINKTGVVFMMTSRGCPFACSFCPSSAYWKRFIVQRSAKNVFEEIKYLISKYPYIKHISFADDEFICNNQRVIELCKLIIDNNLKIKWNCLGRASSINDELIMWMKKAGCFEICFGVESGSQRILDNIGKKVKISQIINSFEICKKYGIKTRCLTIVGLPGENAESVKETISLARKLKISTEPAILIVFPGTKVYELAKEKGLLTDDYWLGEGLCPLYTCEHPKWRLWWWSFKTGLITYYYNPEMNALEFLSNKFLRKLTPHNFFRVVKRYITDKA